MPWNVWTRPHVWNVGVLILVSLASQPALASAEGERTVRRHPVSVVEADIYVKRFSTTMRLKCFAEDLELLQGVEALEDGFYDSDELREATRDHAEYLAERITIRDRNGDLLEPQIAEVIDIEIPEDGIPAGKLMEYTMGFVLEYKYEEPPEFITIQQDMVAEGQLLPSEFKILLKQAGSDTPYAHMMKPGQPETFRFDWDAPVLNQEDSEEEWSKWFEEQREKTLGITSYSSVYSFIYITDYEVRHEVLIPLATLTTLIDLERREESFLDVDEQEAAAERIREFFSIGNPVRIDGIEVQPVFDRIDFYGLDLRDFAVQAEKRKVSMANGRVGLILSYSTKGSPTEVEVTWDKFNNAIKTVDAVVFAGADVAKTQFSMFLSDNTYRWSAPDRPPLPEITGLSAAINPDDYLPPQWTIPLISTGLLLLVGIALCVGLLARQRVAAWVIAGLLAVAAIPLWGTAVKKIPDPLRKAPQFSLEPDEARQVFAQLHKNLFRAFDYHDEGDIYDALAKSVDGDLLRKLYLDIHQSLKVKEQGGAVARIQEVQLLEGEPIPGPEDAPPISFAYRCKWNLSGTIEHWGHIHQRENRYQADFGVSLEDGAWKITEMEVTDEEQGVVKTSLRQF